MDQPDIPNLKLWPQQNLEVISNNYLEVISDNYQEVIFDNYLEVIFQTFFARPHVEASAWDGLIIGNESP